MAFVNIHSIPGVTVSLSYWLNLTLVPSPSTPVSLSGGVYTVDSYTTEWDRVVFEITSYGTGVLPVTGRISVTNARVDSPYDGVVAIASGTTYASIIASDTFPPDSVETASISASMSLANKYMFFGHNAGASPSIWAGAEIVLEMDGDFPLPEFWQDFNETIEDGTLTKTAGLVFVPTQQGNPAMPEHTYCLPDPPPPPGPGCTSGCRHPVTGDCYPCPGGSSGGGSDPPEGTRPPPDVLLCWPVPGGTCCRYPGIGVICTTN